MFLCSSHPDLFTPLAAFCVLRHVFFPLCLFNFFVNESSADSHAFRRRFLRVCASLVYPPGGIFTHSGKGKPINLHPSGAAGAVFCRAGDGNLSREGFWKRRGPHQVPVPAVPSGTGRDHEARLASFETPSSHPLRLPRDVLQDVLLREKLKRRPGIFQQFSFFFSPALKVVFRLSASELFMQTEGQRKDKLEQPESKIHHL